MGIEGLQPSIRIIKAAFQEGSPYYLQFRLHYSVLVIINPS